MTAELSVVEETSDSAPTTRLHLDPRSDSVQIGKTTTYELVVNNAQTGVGGAELAVVVDDSSVAKITDVGVLGSGDQTIELAQDGSRVDLEYASRDTADSGGFSIIEVTVEGRMAGEAGLSIAAAEGNDKVLLFNEEGTEYNVTGTTGATLMVKSDDTPPDSTAPDYFQIDLVEGGVIQQLDPDVGDTYHKQDRFIMALIISEDERQRGGPGTPMSRTYQSDGCKVTYSWLSFDNSTGQSQVAVSVSEAGGCEGITLSYAGYELPDGTTEWNADRADEQELKDSVTVTLQPGEEETLTIDVIPNGSSSASIGVPAGASM